MTCHHTRKPFVIIGDDGEVTAFYADRRIGDKDRCRCVHHRYTDQHCHQKIDGEDMICTPCRNYCQPLASDSVFRADVTEEFANSSNALSWHCTCGFPFVNHRD